MTHAWKGVARPWHVSILWNKDRRLAGALLKAFAADAARVIGDNEPYHGGLEGDTIWQHARPHELPNAVIEYRQDLVADAAGQAYWADVTYTILAQILAATTRMDTPNALSGSNGAAHDNPRSKDANRVGSSSVPPLGGAPA